MKFSLPTIGCFLLLASGCTALTNFGEFVFEDLGSSTDMAGADLTDNLDLSEDATVPPDMACGTPATCDPDGRTLIVCGVRLTCTRCVPGGAVFGATNQDIPFDAHCAPEPSNIDKDAAQKCLEGARGQITTLDDNARYRVDTTKLVIINQTNTTSPEIPLTPVNDNLAAICRGSLVGRNVTLDIVGSRGLLIAVDSILDLDANIDVAGADASGRINTQAGPGGGTGGVADEPGQVAGQTGGPSAEMSNGGGGGGGSLLDGAAGGDTATGKNIPGGKAGKGLLGGGGGGSGGHPNAKGTGAAAGTGGGGGGSLQFTAGLLARFSGVLNGNGASGSPGGSGSGLFPGSGGGGGGGGAGGTVWFEAPLVAFVPSPSSAQRCLATYGGAGGMGGTANAVGDPADSDVTCPFLARPATATAEKPGAGGDPAAFGNASRYNGKKATGNFAAGGGAGAPGKVQIRSLNEFTAINSREIVHPIESLRWERYTLPGLTPAQ